ncbi:putative NrdI-like protein [compost metagenome]
MLVAYDSKTGNVRRFVQKLNYEAIQIEETMTIDEPFILVTYTTGFGQVPDKVNSFLQRNHSLMAGVSASGNRNWGDGFAKSADTIAEQYGVPIISKFELSGTTQDIERFVREMNEFASH